MAKAFLLSPPPPPTSSHNPRPWPGLSAPKSCVILCGCSGDFYRSPWDPAGLVWHGKRPKAGNGKKMEIEMENGPKLGRGKNGNKMAQKWKNEGVFHYFSIFGPFCCHFCPCPDWGRFPFRFPFFFSISGFWPFSMPYQPGRIPTLPSKIARFLWPQDARFPCDQNSLANGDFLCDENGQN